MKTKEELYQKNASLQDCHGLYSKRTSKMVNKIHKAKTQDHLGNHQAIRRITGKPGTNAFDYRIPGVPFSVVEQQDTNRQNKIKKLIEKFENQQHKESFIQDLSQTQKTNKFSKESQDLIADMNNTEIFEPCENSSKQQCPDCDAYWEIGIVYCSCGRNLKSSQRPKEFEKNICDVSSIPGNVIKKNSSRGAKHGPSERQRMHHKAKEVLLKARQEKHESHSSMLARWNDDCKYGTSLSLIGWTEQDLMLFDSIALENQSYVATKAETI